MIVAICCIGHCTVILTAQEIIAVLVGLMSFETWLEGRKVIVYSDNAGAEGSIRKGSATAPDQNRLIHGVWSLVMKLKIHLWIERVPSEDNIADSPSRFDYELLTDIGAAWVAPRTGKELVELFRGQAAQPQASVQQ